MTESKFLTELNTQVGREFAASQQYTAIAIYYDGQTLPQLASFFYKQALEERNHAMMMLKYLLDVDAKIEIPGTDAPQSSFKDFVEPIALALEQEKQVTAYIDSLASLARNEGTYAGEQFMQWFVKEQVEEVSTMSDLLAVAKRSKDNSLLLEEFLVRESFGDGDDANAPAAAGGL